MNPSITNRSLAKVRFFAIYALSVVLIVFLLSSFLMPVREVEGTTSSPVINNDKQASTVQLLNQRLSSLHASAVSYLEKGAPADGLKEVSNQKTALLTTVDSLRREGEEFTGDGEKAASENLLKSFVQMADKQYKFVQAYASKASGKSPVVTTSNAELEELKAILVQKDEKIAELEQRGQPSQNRESSTADSEWKDRYNKLKATSDKSASQMEAMKESYREVVEDNRRLITQLQAARAGKN